MNKMGFSHLDEQGQIKMVNVGEKQDSRRIAIAEGFIRLNAKTLRLLKEKALPKGDVLTTAKIAGIMAAKKTAELIPLCHPLKLTFVDVSFEVLEEEQRIRIESKVETTDKTGVEMEALVAVNVAMLTIYDMCKAVQKDIILEKSRLLYKEGGKSGIFKAD
ncbi:MAG: cyclic pyranopterin monophosphate synthase [Desulfonauticus sp.]|nr:MAG: Cyclic pyranopterin monophosphate synthase accessory protein [Desulfonauticus sp. 38_4375]MDK2921131.1 cyclic pyranopterin monophosphate synthase [Desulfonauticus sp.]